MQFGLIVQMTGSLDIPNRWRAWRVRLRRPVVRYHFKYTLSQEGIMEELAIGEVARQAGIRPSALRYYESIGLLPAPRRVSGRRRYDESTVQMLRVVQLAQQAGFTVAELKNFLQGLAPDTPPAARWRPLAQQKNSELDALIVRAQQMKFILENGLNCGCLRLEDCAIALERGCCEEQVAVLDTATVAVSGK
jgi:MerR family redox-sensitive transcriptional activator SoxR